jgi:hypothetical protein
MNIKQVSFGAVFATRQYENKRFGLVADLEPDESPEEAIAELERRVVALAGPNAQEQYDRLHELSVRMHTLDIKLKEKQQQYEAVKEFLLAQGLKDDMPDFPIIAALKAPGPERVTTSVVEIDEGDEDEGDEDEAVF